MDGGPRNFILVVAAEHLADFNSPAEQKETKKQKTTPTVFFGWDFLST